MLPIDNDIREEILNVDGNVVVSASAGTGKTHTTVMRINQDVSNLINHQTFAAITFTRKAAQEIRERVGFNEDGFIGTNDNFVLTEIIQPFMYDVYGEEFKTDIKQNFSDDNRIESFEIGIERIRTSGYICKFDTNYKNFAFQLALDILKRSKSARRYIRAKYFRLYIDEYQDSDVDMHNLFIYICEDLKVPIFVVGDIKQSIYGWRGAHSEGFQYLIEHEEFNAFQLWHNFRSNKVIQNYSNIFMKDVRNNFQAVEFDAEVQSYRFTDQDQAVRFIAKWLDKDSRCSFLNYSNNSAEQWSEMLSEEDADFVYIPPSPLDFSNLESEHVWIARLLACYLLEDRFNEHDVFLEIPLPESFEFHKIRGHLQKISKNKNEENNFIEACLMLYSYLDYPDINDQMLREISTLFEVVNDERYIPSYNEHLYKHTTSTIHSSKGLEYEQVIIVGNDFNFSSDNDRYLHYVAVSRPQSRLLVLIYDDVRGKNYLRELNRVVNKTADLGFNVKLQNVIKRYKHRHLL